VKAQSTTPTRRACRSSNRNLWHISHEGADLESPANEPKDELWLISVPVSKAPDAPEYVTIDFRAGNPIALNGKEMPAAELIAALNTIGGKHAVGQTQLAENRLVGMKSRGAYETPGGTILYEGHKALEQITIERDTSHYKQQVALKYAEMVYNGQWFHPLREALQAFVDHTQAAVTGQVKVKLFKGRATTAGVTSPHSLYDPQLASFSMEGYDVTAARGFIDLFGLPMKVASQVRKW
jgi:argininosuccinate synthase